jgi:hypothetical protein
VKRMYFGLRIACLSLLAATLLQSAAPWIVIISGSLVKQGVILDRWEQNLRFMLAVKDGVDIDPGSLIGRPHLDLSLYWGPDWKKYMEQSGRPETLSPNQSNQRGRFYPAVGSNPAVVELDSSQTRAPRYRSVSADGLMLLTNLGVPTRVER